MVATETDPSRKREYVIIKHGPLYYYARASREDDDTYIVMVSVEQKEGKKIIAAANATSNYQEFLDEREAKKSQR